MVARLLQLSLLVLVAHAIQCEKSSECVDDLDCSLDFCEPRGRRCINISREPSCNTTRREIDRDRLEEFMNRVPLPLSDRLAIIRRISKVLLSYHPHRLLHLRFLKVDPVRLLARLGKQLQFGLDLNKIQFHTRIFDVFQRLNDLHTIYISPSPLKNSRVFLPFTFREYYTQSGQRSFVVTDVAVDAEFKDKSFRVGSEIIKWDGEDIEDALVREGEDGYGSNPAAQFANAIFTIRSKFPSNDPLPMRDFVDVGFKNNGTGLRTVRVDWIYTTLVNNDSLPFFKEDPNFPGDPQMASSSVLEYEHETKGFSTEQDIKFAEKQLKNMKETSRQNLDRRPIAMNSTFCRFFSGEIIGTRFGRIGLLRLSSFTTPRDVPLIDTITEFARLVSRMPRRGLIVDIRSNRGGFVILGEIYIQLLTNETFQIPTKKLRATRLLERIVSGNRSMLEEPFSAIFPPIRTAMRTARLAGDPYIGSMNFEFGFPRLAPVYNHSYIVVGDGLTYSGGDAFAATHVDHGLAPVVLIGENVGAGGSTVREYAELSEGIPGEFPPLPGGVEFSTSSFRLMRTGRSAGAILENFGIEPDVVYKPTLRDRLESDVDMIDFLAGMVTDGSMETGEGEEGN